MREFNGFNVLKVITENYKKSFPNRKIKISILTYSFTNEMGHSTNMFFCFDPKNTLVGHAVHYGYKKMLRFYDYEGTDVGLETNMIFKPLKVGKGVKRTKIKH